MAFARILPPAVLRRVADRSAFLNEVSRYVGMKDNDLLHATKICLRNLEPLDDGNITKPDGALQLVLVPELWERLRAGTRDMLRRITSGLAEYNPDPARPSIFAKNLRPEAYALLHKQAEALRLHITRAASLDTQALVEQVRFAIAGSRAATRWSPADFVYEPGFVYRLVPALAWRVLERCRSRNLEKPRQ